MSLLLFFALFFVCFFLALACKRLVFSSFNAMIYARHLKLYKEKQKITIKFISFFLSLISIFQLFVVILSQWIWKKDVISCSSKNWNACTVHTHANHHRNFWSPIRLRKQRWEQRMFMTLCGTQLQRTLVLFLLLFVVGFFTIWYVVLSIVSSR